MSRNSVAIKEPLAPAVLSKAGVPLSDALWFSRLPPGAKVQALSIPRGQSILNCVRKYMSQEAANDAPQMLSAA